MKHDFDFYSNISKAHIHKLPVKKFEGRILTMTMMLK